MPCDRFSISGRIATINWPDNYIAVHTDGIALPLHSVFSSSKFFIEISWICSNRSLKKVSPLTKLVIVIMHGNFDWLGEIVCKTYDGTIITSKFFHSIPPSFPYVCRTRWTWWGVECRPRPSLRWWLFSGSLSPSWTSRWVGLPSGSVMNLTNTISVCFLY